MTIPIVVPSGSTSPPASGATVGGSVVQLPSDAYGPVTIGSAVYASSDATQTVPLAHATVVVGPLPVFGATPPAVLPAGDVAAMTAANGAFALTPPVAPAAIATSAPFVIPQNNVLGFTAPATGYYVSVFAAGSDGVSAGTVLPLHRFVAASTSLALHVSSLAPAEANALAIVNSDRLAHAAGSLIIDDSAEEIARLHAADESVAQYTCHYDTHNIGPASRYLATGGLGLTGEGLGLTYGPDAATAFQANETAFLAEAAATPPGGHYTNLVDISHAWAGLAIVADPFASGFFNIDYELITPNGQSRFVGASGYPVDGLCPAGTAVNNS